MENPTGNEDAPVILLFWVIVFCLLGLAVIALNYLI